MIKRKGLPEMNELVMCTVRRITPYAAWCDLDEYDAEGMIHVSEAAGKWVRDIRDFVKQDKQYVAKVVRMDLEKKVVNLSLKRLSRHDEKEKMNSFRSAQHAEKILEQAAKQLNKTLEKAYDEVGYLLQENFGELSTAFEEAKRDPAELEKAGVPKKWADALMPIIEKALKDREIILKAELDLKSYEGDGITRVKDVLAQIQKSGMKVHYISAPKYTVEMRTKDPKTDEKRMRDRLDEVASAAKEKKIEFGYKMAK